MLTNANKRTSETKHKPVPIHVHYLPTLADTNATNVKVKNPNLVPFKTILKLQKNNALKLM